MGMNKVVTQLSNKDLVICVDCDARDHLHLSIGVDRVKLEIMPENLRRRIDGKGLSGAFDSRKGKEEKKFLRRNVLDHVVITRNNVDVVTPANHEFDPLLEKIRA